MRIALLKVRRDLWQNKGRTILVVLSIAVGVMAIGMITSSNFLLNRQMTESHLSSNPSHAWLYLNGNVDESTVRSLARTDGVAQMEGFTDIGVEWKASPDGEWRDGRIIMIEDYDDQLFDQFKLLNGIWPNDNSVAIEFNSVAGWNTPDVGGTVYFNVNDRARPMVVGGMLRDPFQFPPPFNTDPAFYVTRDVLQSVTGVTGYDTLRFTTTEYSEDNVNQISDEIDDKLQRQGMGVGFTQVLHPEEHFLQDTINGIGLILSVMAIASLGLSTFLVINIINALVTQQISQIGIMKAVGGVTRQIAMLYLAGVIVYGFLSLLVAIPLGALFGDVMARWMLSLLNVPSSSFEVLPATLTLQLVTGLLTPLLAALYPVLRGVAIAVATALRERGLGGGNYGTGWIDRLIGRIRGLPSLAALALRNTFRRPARVALTMLTLTTAGAIFIMVLSTQHSFNSTIDKIFRGFGFEVMVGFEQQQRVDEIIPLIEARPNVELAEMWIFTSGEAHVPGETGPGSVHEIFPRGVPRDTVLFSPELTSGRYLDPEDGRAMLLNQKLAGRMDVSVGDEIIMQIGDGDESTWTVVGLVFDLAGRDQDTAFVFADELAEVQNQVGRGSVVEVRATEDTLAMQKAVEADLLQYFDELGIGVSFTDTAQENRQQARSQFNIITTILLVMTILMAIVGSIGLSGTLSINVIERRREIGVMRAVGASSTDVGRVFSGEGLMLGLISWAQAVPLALLAGPVFVRAIGTAIDFPAVYAPAFQGIWIWFIIVVVLSLVASWLPARRATQISVNESLAYE
ncbi:MAG: ABC transporter permease [Chloroflexi bacterium]|nr:MAG: ABC transporter permease [Chloroflexota bacterium]MBL1192985.1 ABC transporter permease [Chloroflexota bacterium]NOH10277.1 ABC transporter permease [Chloroflexota bacterium]